MRSLLGLAAAAFLVAAGGACGNIISVPDQGTQILGCRSPDACFRVNTQCVRGAVTYNDMGKVISNGDPNLSSQQVPTVCANGTTPTTTDDPATCYCPATSGDMAVVCLEPSMLCVGRGVLCTGVGAVCIRSGQTCDKSAGSSDATPPSLVTIADDGGTPTQEPHCAYVDDVCCPGTIGTAGDMSATVDGGATDGATTD